VIANQTPARKKILVVDDNPVILRALSAFLESHGFEVMMALDGSEVVGQIRKRRPDLILLDIFFPPNATHGSSSWDGFLILEWLNKMGKGSDIPFFVISSADAKIYKKRSLDAGAKAFFSKPLPMKELLEAVRATLGLAKTVQPKPKSNAVDEAGMPAA
jgi:CheY-like chemotaxis protein